MELADEALKMAGALAAVIALLLGGMFILKRVVGESPASLGGPIVRLLGGLRLGQGKTIMLVEVAGEVLVLGSTARDLTLLTRVDEMERVEQLRTLPSHPVGNLGMWTSHVWSGLRDRSLSVEEKVKNT